MSEWVDGDPLPILVDPIGIDNNPPEDGKIRSAVAQLSNGHAAGASRMRAKDVKGWLSGIQDEENPNMPENPSEGIIGNCLSSWSRQSGPTESSPANCSGSLLF